MNTRALERLLATDINPSIKLDEQRQVLNMVEIPREKITFPSMFLIFLLIFL